MHLRVAIGVTLFMRHVLGILIAIVSIAWTGAGRADEPPTVTPAILIAGNKHPIDKKIVFPKTDGDLSGWRVCFNHHIDLDFYSISDKRESSLVELNVDHDLSDVREVKWTPYKRFRNFRSES